MAVYTDVPAEELAAFLAGYDLGELLAYKGIAEGVENSNYLVTTERGNYILAEGARAEMAAPDEQQHVDLVEPALDGLRQRPEARRCEAQR